jgi:hypothetical protein
MQVGELRLKKYPRKNNGNGVIPRDGLENIYLVALCKFQ